MASKRSLWIVAVLVLELSRSIFAFTRHSTSSTSSRRVRQHSLTRSSSSILPLQTNKQHGLSLQTGLKSSITNTPESDFESWFSKFPGATCDASIEHAYFGTLRGLCWKQQQQEEEPSSPKMVASIPRGMVLQSDCSNPNWDVELAQSIWKECQQKEQSNIWGYCRLLSSSQEEEHGSVCPNALRHWTEEQKSILGQTAAGQKLLSLEQTQMDSWKNKYVASKNTMGMSWEDFVWAMEVVHSRAFRGNFGSRSLSSSSGGGVVTTIVQSALVPLVAAIGGWFYFFNSNPITDNQDVVFLALAAFAAAPLLLQLVGGDQKDEETAVLLPLIDSANHMEQADSSIDYDPLSNAFQLQVGPRSFVDEKKADNQSKQLYISYGKRSDAELLLDYGFLPGVSETTNDRDEQRRVLAEAFQQRNG